MSALAIRVEHLGKRYLIGHQVEGDLRNSFRQKIQRLAGKVTAGREEEFWALRDVSFQVNQGDVIGFIGRNGAGKSTLLKILSRITSPTTGRFEINGRVSSLLEVGTGFHAELTGRENVYLNGTILGMRRAEIKEKFDAIVDFSGVEKFVDTPVKHYSSGMKVRLAFSIAAHLEPEILIIDEVLAVGDADFQKKCLGKMDEVSKKEGRTVLFVSHNMAAVETLCTAGIVLNQGQIVFQGSTHDAVHYYFQQTILENGQQVPYLVALGNHPNKRYHKDFGLLKAVIHVNGKKSNLVSPGDDIDIDFTYRFKDEPFNPVLGVVIKDVYGQAIIGVNNKHTAQRFYRGERSDTVRFSIRDFAAYGAGQLMVDLYMGDNGDDFDIIKDAFHLELTPVDTFQTGVFVNPNLNRIFQPLVSFTARDTEEQARNNPENKNVN